MKESTPSLVAQWGVLIAGTVAVSIGAFWLVVWLTGVGGGWSAASIITVKTNTALGQLLAGAALLLASGGARGWRRLVGILFSVIVLLIGALTLSEHLFGWNLGIDQLLATEAAGAAATASPNRMGPPGATSLTLIGAGLLALAWRRKIAPYLGLATCIIIVVPAVGFLYGIHEFYGKASLTGIAWPTVVALFSLGTGLTLARPEGGPMALLLRDDAGGMLLRRLFPVAVLVPLALGFLKVQAVHRGLYETATGTGILVLALIVVFSLFLWRSAANLSRSVQAQSEAEQQSHSVLLFPSENPNPVMRVSSDGQLLYSNASSEVLLLCWGDNSKLTLPDNLVESAAEALRAGTVRELDIECGQTVFSFVIAPIANQNYVNLYGRDITERKHAEEALVQANQELDVRAEEMQSLNEELAASNEEIAAVNEELRVANSELHQEIEERKRAEDALREADAHKLDFYRRTILAATGGKLIITERAEIEAMVGPAMATMNIDKVGELWKARSVARQAADSLGMARDHVHRLVASVGEATSNVVKHADHGLMSIHRTENGLLVMVADDGPGIDALDLPDVALTPGFSTVGTAGLGYKMIIECADRVYLSTGSDGTTVAFEVGHVADAK